MDETTYIPRRINDPWKIVWFDAEVVLAFSAVFVIATLVDYMKMGALLGALAGWAVQKVKSDQHPGFFWHLVYWYLPQVFTPLKRTPPSHLREMVG